MIRSEAVERSDVYISYANEDRVLAREIQVRLNARNLSVFIDVASISVGERFAERIVTEIEKASCVVALFTNAGVRSRWVVEESYLARQRGTLLPVVIGGARLPLGFEDMQPAYLTDSSERGFDKLVDQIEAFLDPRGAGRSAPLRGSSRVATSRRGAERVWAYALFTLMLVLVSLWSRSRFGSERHLLWLLVPLLVALTGYEIQRFRRSFSTVDTPLASRGAAKDPSPTEASPNPLFGLAREFFKAAGRSVSEIANDELRIPEPVLVPLRESPASADVDRLRGLLGSFKSGFLVYRDKLPGEVEDAVTRLRIRGLTIGALSDRLMRAALDDGRAKQALAEIEREASGNDNLFRTKNALLLPRYFFGREQLLAELGQMLARGEHVLLLGTRKCGKTSCLNMLRQSLVEYPIAMVDLQKYDRNNEEWHLLLFADLLSAYDRWGEARFGRWPFGRDTPSTGTALHEALRKRHEWVQESGDAKPLVVILDELERVIPRASENDAARRFVLAVGALRNLGQGENRLISLIGADLRPDSNRVNLLPNGETNPIFGLLNEKPLRPLEPSQVRDMVKFIAGKMGVQEVKTEFVDELQRLSGGHAYLCRLLAAAAYDARGKGDQLLARHVASGLESLNDEGEVTAFLEQNFWAPLSAREQAYLVAVANARKPPDDEIARASLNQQSLCIKNRIPVELFRDWIRERTPSVSELPVT